MKLRTMLHGLVGAGIVAVALASPVALAQSDDNDDQGRPSRRSVPEFDPAAVGAIAAVVAGGGVLLARRRKKN